VLAVALLRQVQAYALLGKQDDFETVFPEVLEVGRDDPEVVGGALGYGRATLFLVLEDRRQALEALDTAVATVSSASATSAEMYRSFRVLLRSVEGAGEEVCDDVRASGIDVYPFNQGMLRLAEAVHLGRAGRAQEAAAAVEEGSTLLEGVPWHRHYARRLAAEAALADNWADPVAWLREGLSYFEAKGQDRVADACRALLRKAGAGGSFPPTVLFIDVVGSTGKVAELGDRRWAEVLQRFYMLVQAELARLGGREVKTMGDGVLAAFTLPSRAVQAALAVRDGVRRLGLEVRAGLHSGECELIGDDLSGLAVHIGARVAARADPGEVLVSSAVRDSAIDCGLSFADRGVHTLRGVPGHWRLYSAGT
jgi:class 3 adenylate cyclase